jgi:uncharacterized protein YcaQ
MVVERRNFQRVYDLTHRVMPHWDDERDALSREDAEAIMLRNSARSLGIFRAQWLADYYRLRQPALPGCWRPGRKRGWWFRLTWKRWAMWLHHEALAQLETAPGGADRQPQRGALALRPGSGIGNAPSSCSFQLSPGVLYPAPKRQYGYLFCRCCTGKTGRAMDIKCIAKPGAGDLALWLEEGVKVTRGLEQGCAGRLTTLRAGNRQSVILWDACRRAYCRPGVVEIDAD